MPLREDITQLVKRIESGDNEAASELLPLLYDELRQLAATRLAQESPGHTLQATALVHEAYFRLVGSQGDDPKWENRAHFFGAAVEAMRRVLIDHARAKGAAKRGGDAKRLTLDSGSLTVANVPPEIVDLDEALTTFEQEDPAKAMLVKLRFFAGLSLREAAEVLGISPATADRHWAYARAWLFDALKKQ
jgi:RNA polymerase sigma factor (TIGR02999 family)